jgi:hypothetical protein
MVVLKVATLKQSVWGYYVKVQISLQVFLSICSTTKKLFLEWVKEVRTTKS